MKKIYLLGFLAVLTGCVKPVQNAVVADNEPILNACETQVDLNTMMLVEKSCAKMSLTSEKATQGATSVKVESYYNTCCSSLMIYQSLRNVALGLDYTDFTNYSKVCFSFFNATSIERKLIVAAISKNTYQLGQNRSQDFTFTVKPGEWVEIEYSIDVSKVELVDGKRYVCGIDLVLPRGSDTVVPDVYYIDNFRVK